MLKEAYLVSLTQERSSTKLSISELCIPNIFQILINHVTLLFRKAWIRANIQKVVLTGIRGSHILTIDETVSLKNIEELVQEREAT